MMSHASSGVVCSIRSNVKPALFTMWLIFPNFLCAQRPYVHRGQKVLQRPYGLPVGPRMSERRDFTYLIVAEMTFSGKSSAETSPPTASASPPAALISSTTACAFFSSRLQGQHNHVRAQRAGDMNLSVGSANEGEENTHSVTTTFAPSFAKSNAQLRPIPYGGNSETWKQ